MTFPPLDSLAAKPRGLVLHWTAGRHTASDYERTRYHLLAEHHISDLGHHARLVAGVPVGRNMRPLRGVPAYHTDPKHGYAAHAGGWNTGTVGLAACGMRGTVDYRPGGDVYPGPEPITLHQIRLLLGTTVQFVRWSGLEVHPEIICTHYELWKRGIGRSKWNISWLPGLGLAADDVGDYLRDQVRRWLRGELIDDRLYAPPLGDQPEAVLRGDEVV